MQPIAINTLAYHGYPLETAMEEIARLSGHIEPVYISKYDPALAEDYFTPANARQLSSRLAALGLRLTAMASHMDLGLPDAVPVFRRRMEFASDIGARFILTNASRTPQAAQFFSNLEALAARAEALDLVIALENPGDGQDQLLGTGAQGVAILRRLGSERVKLNYDFSNIFTYSKGRMHPEQELDAVLPFIAHLHLKNVKSCDGAWPVCGAHEGIIDYPALFRRFPALRNLPLSIEMPIRFGYDADFNFTLHQKHAPPLESIRKILADSLACMNLF